ncbi:MAG: ribonuclease Z [Lachnospiraceae bacterium]|nr:ribonuclease Z [Lachnospiraceae bacterium]MDD5853355.1 ribonuclease Z [Lachnospiraceae bacterium]
MNVIVCVDNDMGMLFNHRRQSRDKNVVDIICNLTENTELWISNFSKDLFKEDYFAEGNNQIIIDDDFLQHAAWDDYCFVEDRQLQEYKDQINKIYIFRWNTDYPADFKLDLDMKNFHLEKTEDFKGNSHEKITLEVHIKQKAKAENSKQTTKAKIRKQEIRR